jgi:hypothetical protein
MPEESEQVEQRGTVTVGPHQFRSLRTPRWWRRGDDRCFHCFLPESEHPVGGWVKARPLLDESPSRPNGLREHERTTPLTINGVPAADFIKRAYDLGSNLNGPGRFEVDDPIQTNLRHIKGWVEQAERDALDFRKANALPSKVEAPDA